MSLLSQSPSPHQSCEMLINKTLKLATQFELTNYLLVSQFLGNLNPLQVVVKQKQRKKESFHKLDLRILMKPMG